MPKWTKSATIKDFYKSYLYRKSPDHPNYVSKKQHKEILKDIFEEIQKYIIEGNVYDIPWGLGEIRVNKIKIKQKPRNYNQEKLNYAKTGEWKEIYHQNFHTDGYKLKLGWYRRGDAFRNRNYYRFLANRKFQKKLVNHLKTTGDVSRYTYFNKELPNHLHKLNVLV